MLQALIFICNVGVAVECDDARSIFVEAPPDVYETQEECQKGTVKYIHDTLDLTDVIKRGQSYQVTISCRIPKREENK